MPTSTLHELRSQAVPVSDGMPAPIVHGVAVLQKSTFVTGSAEAGPKLGTANGPTPALGLGLAVGLVAGGGVGGGFGGGLGVRGGVGPPGGRHPGWGRTPPPIVPSSRISTTAMIAGTSQGGRSLGPPPPP